jgi:hypothetical protein
MEFERVYLEVMAYVSLPIIFISLVLWFKDRNKTKWW